MNFEATLENYANLLICHGLNVQEGQIVNLTGEIVHRSLLNKLTAAAYRRGAKYVNVDYVDYLQAKQRLELSQNEEFLTYVPSSIPAKFNELLENHGAALRLVGSEDPDSLASLAPSKINTMQLSTRQSLKRYFQEGVGKSQIHWTVAAAATPKWGKKVFPELSENEACEYLWKDIFKICRVDSPDYLERWQTHDAALRTRAKLLTEMKIKTLHFTGPGTDLRVGLSRKAIFKGGGDVGPYKVPFEPNIPTEECFTTPDYRQTEGIVKVTRPFFVNGKLIEGLTLKFEQGIIKDFTAIQGAETFLAYIESDEGGRRLGEVALVGIDSPIYQSGRIYQEILFDENAACHIAVGFAYRFCLEEGGSMQAAELDAIGCNDSHVHTDMMISTEDVDVKAVTYNNEEIYLIRKGRWVI